MKRIIDDKGRLFGRVSFIDIIVLAVVIVLAVATLVKFRGSDTPVTTTNTVKVTYTVVIPGTRLNIADLIRPGDNLYTELGTFIGVIKDVGTAAATTPQPRVDGTYVMASVQDRYDIYLTVESNCSSRDGRYYAEKVYELSANSEQRMTTKYNIFTGVILSVAAG